LLALLVSLSQGKCKATNGFMIQVEEKEGLGTGQMIETTMAKEVGMKVFRTYTDCINWNDNVIKKLSDEIKEWYFSG